MSSLPLVSLLFFIFATRVKGSEVFLFVVKRACWRCSVASAADLEQLSQFLLAT